MHQELQIFNIFDRDSDARSWNVLKLSRNDARKASSQLENDEERSATLIRGLNHERETRDNGGSVIQSRGRKKYVIQAAAWFPRSVDEKLRIRVTRHRRVTRRLARYRKRHSGPLAVTTLKRHSISSSLRRVSSRRFALPSEQTSPRLDAFLRLLLLLAYRAMLILL